MSCILILGCLFTEGGHPKHQIIKYEHWFAENTKTDDCVVDIGSNTGRMAALACHVSSVYGIEIDKDLHGTVSSAENLKFINYDATLFDLAGHLSYNAQ